ncbi:uncharacterized protein LOC122072163 isoform X2 [Macadamia integrifolia]|uniref:uncharacterized protein LOC122072163 isoform X2 n=1 Tax=Macadamia integrifolia TaxID=60698 RepID=UPI001C4F7E30|nr:uncharacterized protein LOC122072163 isoform X2 [Macadamia integrifolia]
MDSEEEKGKQEDSSNSSSWPHNPPYIEKEGEEMKVWGILLFGLIGATATTFALSRSKGTTGGSFRSSFREEAWKRYNRRMQEEYEDEMERVERIRRMQSVFNRERNKYKRSHESWGDNGPGAYHQHFQRNDWYWKTDTSNREQRTNSRATAQVSGNISLSHHYSVLGLDRWRSKPYTETEIKTAFRAKAMEYHPDQNKDNKEGAEAKFKEVLLSYEAIKSERKNEKL